MKIWYQVKLTHGKYEVWFCYENSKNDVQRIHIGDATNQQEVEETIEMFIVASDTQQVNYI